MQNSHDTLYDRLGGEPAINAAVDVFYRRVLADNELAPFFESVDMRKLRAHQFAFLSQALGGPRQYSGASMTKAHAKLAITQRDFDLVAGHLVETLRELGAGQEIIDEVCFAVAPLASQIVNSGPQSPGFTEQSQQDSSSGHTSAS